MQLKIKLWKIMMARPEMLASTTVQEIVSHLGGEARLSELGARGFFADETHVSFKLIRPNPKGVRSVVISFQGNNFFEMNCYGPFTAGGFQAPLVATANGILAENLATVLGQLTGIESLHHRHF
jgi:hypothetical protein